MKTSKILTLSSALLMIIALATNCSEEEGVTYSLSDVSDRVTGFATEKAGTGAPLTVNGSQMDKVLRVAVGNLVVPAKLFTAVSESSITFTVPANAVVGPDQPLLFVYPGDQRAFKDIEVIRFQAISDFAPRSVVEGDSLTIAGGNLDVVTAVSLGGTNAPFKLSGTVLRVYVPAGVSDGPITLTSEAGSSSTTTSLLACPSNSPGADCADGLTLNAGLELGDADNFTNWGKWNGGTKLLVTTNVKGNEVYRGARALKVIRDGTLTPTSDQWRIQFVSDPVAVENGAAYIAYAWVRASAAGGTIRFSNQGDSQYGGDTAVPVTWTRISWRFVANNTSKRVVLDMNGPASAAFNIFVDDIKLIKE